MNRPELLLTNGIPPRQFRAYIGLERLRVAELEAAAQRLSRRPKAGRGRG